MGDLSDSCKYCATSMLSLRSNKKYCSCRCRSMAFRYKKSISIEGVSLPKEVLSSFVPIEVRQAAQIPSNSPTMEVHWYNGHRVSFYQLLDIDYLKQLLD